MATKSTRDHLIDVGVGLMHQNGYNATGLTDILKAADAPKGSFITISGAKRTSPPQPCMARRERFLDA